jgi:D-3-phosphoglycerate dehydrogenase
MSRIQTMKNTAVIINTARGGIINEHDLDKALNEKIILAAGLDVFENEPLNLDSPLLKNRKVILSPHTAALTNECRIRMAKETTQNLVDFFENKINKTMLVNL